ncbi:hypothetical protein Btru_055493 [Bulinus truncatus]|nr:hypothetical protein Btru_055493 [Bulinus truncatus]
MLTGPFRSLPLFPTDKCDRYLDVAIVGAGPAGTYSAYRLRNEDLRIEVFEYSNRVGGRYFTSSLPNVPDVPLEFGGMRFIPKVHTRLVRVIQELGLTSRLFALNYENTADSRFFLRGKSYLPEELTSGDIPYNLSPEEKANQGRIFSIDEALGMVGTKEGKNFMMALDQFESDFAADTSLSYLESNLGPYSGDFPVLTLTQGMSSVPQGLIQKFLNASLRHKLTMNRQLVSISRNDVIGYKLVFQKTKTSNDFTSAQDSVDVVCAKKIILALPKFALSQINWPPLRDTRVCQAINAVREVKVFKIFLTFSTRWWLDSSTYPARVTYSDLSFSQFFDWGRSNVTGHYVMMASYADETRAKLLGKLNAEGEPLNGSVGGSHKVSSAVVDILLDDLARAYGTDRRYVPQPISAAAQFWDSYPFGAGWTVWKVGYRYDDVISTVQRPSLTDDVFYVGDDHAVGYQVGWAEGALESVDRVIDKYFL